MLDLARYGHLTRAPGAAPLMAAAFLARLPIGMHALAIVLFARHETGSYATAGALSACFAVGAGLGGPVVGRLVDLRGQRTVLLPLTALHSGALLAFVTLLLLAETPVALAGLPAVVSGLCLPPMSSLMRSMWPELVRHDTGLVTAAFALESVTTESVFVIGPLLVAVSVAVASPQLALVLAAVFQLTGTLWFLSRPESRQRRPSARDGEHGVLGALGSPGIRMLLFTTVPLGFTLGTLEVSIPAFAEDVGHRPLAGLLIAMWSVSSVVGGLWYGARLHGRPVAQRYLRLAALLPLAYLPLALAPSLAVMFVLLVPAGLAIAPLLTAGNELAGELAPVGAETEAYTWPIAALVFGIAAGTLVGGVLAEGPGWSTAFLVAAAGSTVCAGAAFAGRAVLARPGNRGRGTLRA
jgi:MFS family permease